MYEFFLQPFADYGFMRRALAGGLAVTVGAVPVGVFMTLRRMSLTGDAMAHAILPGAALAYLLMGMSLVSMTIGGLVAGVAVAAGAGWISRNTSLMEDTSLAALYLLSLAGGVLIMSAAGNKVDLFHVLFGSILAMDNASIFMLTGISTFSLILLTIIMRPLILDCIDPQFLRSVSRSASLIHYLFLLLMVINLVAGFHAIGTLMAVGMMVLPAAAARFWSSSLGGLLGVAVLISFLSSYLGLLLSFHADFPAGPAIVLVHGIAYGISLVLGREGSLWTRIRPTGHLTR